MRVGSPGRIRTSNISVNSLVPDLITIVPEPRQIDGNQQVLSKWEQSDLPSLCGLYSLFAAIHHNSYDTGMTPRFPENGAEFRAPKHNIRAFQLAPARTSAVSATEQPHPFVDSHSPLHSEEWLSRSHSNNPLPESSRTPCAVPRTWPRKRRPPNAPGSV